MNGIEALKALVEGKTIKGSCIVGTMRVIQCGNKWWTYCEEKEKEGFYPFLHVPLQGDYEVVGERVRKKSTRSKNMSKKAKKIDISAVNEESVG